MLKISVDLVSKACFHCSVRSQNLPYMSLRTRKTYFSITDSSSESSRYWCVGWVVGRFRIGWPKNQSFCVLRFLISKSPFCFQRAASPSVDKLMDKSLSLLKSSFLRDISHHKSYFMSEMALLMHDTPERSRRNLRCHGSQ